MVPVFFLEKIKDKGTDLDIPIKTYMVLGKLLRRSFAVKTSTHTSAKTEDPFPGIYLRFNTRTKDKPLRVKNRWVGIHVAVLSYSPAVDNNASLE
jgi:hypothetical protein